MEEGQKRVDTGRTQYKDECKKKRTRTRRPRRKDDARRKVKIRKTKRESTENYISMAVKVTCGFKENTNG